MQSAVIVKTNTNIADACCETYDALCELIAAYDNALHAAGSNHERVQVAKRAGKRPKAQKSAYRCASGSSRAGSHCKS